MQSLEPWTEVVRDALPGSLPTAAGTLLLGLAAAGGLHYGLNALRTLLRRSTNNQKRSRKQKACRQSIEDLCERLREDPVATEEVERITGLSLEELRQELKASRITPLEALRAFQTKAVKAHDVTNCLVEVIVEAEEWAIELEKGPKDGLLYGVPISIKEGVAIKGYDTTMGLVNLIDVPSEQDCAVLKVLKAHGAVPYVRTNVPQLEMSYEPGNPINGLVFNPHNTKHGPGGSSSGEAAIVAYGASILGIGSDIGGSIRVPAHFCGICGIKPTVQRMSNLGVLESLPAEQTLVEATFGPLARDVDSLALTLKVLWNEDRLAERDPKAARMPFDDQVYEGKQRLRVAFYTEAGEGILPVTPGCVRAVHMAKVALEREGHELVPWCPPDLAEAKDIAMAALGTDGGELLIDLLAGDKLDPTLNALTRGINTPRCIRWFIAKTFRPLAPGLADAAEASLGVNTLEYFEMTKKLEKYVQRVHDSWHRERLDAVICPPFAFAAPPLGNADLCFESSEYCLSYNTLNFPAGVVPMTRVTSEDIEKLRDYPTTNAAEIAAKKATEVSEGMPVGVMVVALRYRDELCLRVMKELEPYGEKVKVKAASI